MTKRQATAAADPKSDDRAAHVAELARRVRTGEYQVDPAAVAGALLRRLRSAGAGRGVPRGGRPGAKVHHGARPAPAEGHHGARLTGAEGHHGAWLIAA